MSMCAINSELFILTHYNYGEKKGKLGPQKVITIKTVFPSPKQGDKVVEAHNSFGH